MIQISVTVRLRYCIILTLKSIIPYSYTISEPAVLAFYAVAADTHNEEQHFADGGAELLL